MNYVVVSVVGGVILLCLVVVIALINIRLGNPHKEQYDRFNRRCDDILDEINKHD